MEVEAEEAEVEVVASRSEADDDDDEDDDELPLLPLLLPPFLGISPRQPGRPLTFST